MQHRHCQTLYQLLSLDKHAHAPHLKLIYAFYKQQTITSIHLFIYISTTHKNNNTFNKKK